MKKKILFILLFIFAFALVGCDLGGGGSHGGEVNPDNPDKPGVNETIYEIEHVDGAINFDADKQTKHLFIELEPGLNKLMKEQIYVANGEVISFYEDKGCNNEIGEYIRLNERETQLFMKVVDYKTEKMDVWELMIECEIANEFLSIIDFDVTFNQELKFSYYPQPYEIESMISEINVVYENKNKETINFDMFRSAHDGRIRVNEYDKTIEFTCNNSSKTYEFIKETVLENFQIEIIDNSWYFKTKPTIEEVCENIRTIKFYIDNVDYQYNGGEYVLGLLNENGSYEITEDKITLTIYNKVLEYNYIKPTLNTDLSATTSTNNVRFKDTPTVEDVSKRIVKVKLTNPDGNLEEITYDEFIKNGGSIKIVEDESKFQLLYPKYNLIYDVKYELDYRYQSGKVEVELIHLENSNEYNIFTKKTPELTDILQFIHEIKIVDEDRNTVNLNTRDKILEAIEQGKLTYKVNAQTQEIEFGSYGDVKADKLFYADISKGSKEIGMIQITLYDGSNLESQNFVSFKDRIDGEELARYIKEIRFRYDANLGDYNEYRLMDPVDIAMFVDNNATINQGQLYDDIEHYDIKFGMYEYTCGFEFVDAKNVKDYTVFYNFDILPTEFYRTLPETDRTNFITKYFTFNFNNGSKKDIYIADFPTIEAVSVNTYYENGDRKFTCIDGQIIGREKNVTPENRLELIEDMGANGRIMIRYQNPCFLLSEFDPQYDIYSKIDRVFYAYDYAGNEYEIDYPKDKFKEYFHISKSHNYELGKNKVSAKFLGLPADLDLIMYKAGEEKFVWNVICSYDTDYHISLSEPSVDDLILQHVRKVKIYHYDGSVVDLNQYQLVKYKEDYNISYSIDKTDVNTTYTNYHIAYKFNNFDYEMNFDGILYDRLTSLNGEVLSHRYNVSITLRNQDKDFRIQLDNFTDYFNDDTYYYSDFEFDDPVFEGQRARSTMTIRANELANLVKGRDKEDIVVEKVDSNRLDTKIKVKSLFNSPFEFDFIIFTKDPITTVVPKIDVVPVTNHDNKAVFEYLANKEALADITMYLYFTDEYNVLHIYNKDEAQYKIKYPGTNNLMIYFTDTYACINYVVNDEVLCYDIVDYIMNPTPEFYPVEVHLSTTSGPVEEPIYTYNENVTLETAKEMYYDVTFTDIAGHRESYAGKDKDAFIDKYCRVEKVDNEYILNIQYNNIKEKQKMYIYNLENPKYTVTEVEVSYAYFPASLYNKLTKEQVIKALLVACTFTYKYGNNETSSKRFEYIDMRDSFYDMFTLIEEGNRFSINCLGKPIKIKTNNMGYTPYITVYDVAPVRVETSDLRRYALDISKVVNPNDVIKYSYGYTLRYVYKGLHPEYPNSENYAYYHIRSDMAIDFGTAMFDGPLKEGYNPYTLTIFGQQYKTGADLYSAGNMKNVKYFYNLTNGHYYVEDVNNIDYAKLFYGSIELNDNTMIDCRYVPAHHYYGEFMGKEWIAKYNPTFKLKRIEEQEGGIIHRHYVDVTIQGKTLECIYELYYGKSFDDKLTFSEYFDYGPIFFDVNRLHYGMNYVPTTEDMYNLFIPNVDIDLTYNVSGSNEYVNVIADAETWFRNNSTCQIKVISEKAISTLYKVEFIAKNGKVIYGDNITIYKLVK